MSVFLHSVRHSYSEYTPKRACSAAHIALKNYAASAGFLTLSKECCQIMKDSDLNRQAAGTLIVLASAAGFGVMAILARVAYAAGAGVITIGSIRFTVAAALLWLILAASRVPARVTRRQLLSLALLGGVGYGTMSALFFSAVRWTSPAVAGLLLYTYPALVTVLTRLLGYEALDAGKVVALAGSLAGLVLILGASFAGVSGFGAGLGVAAAVAYSIYIVAGSRVVRRVPPLVTSTYVCSAAAVAYTVIGLATGSLDLALPASGLLAIVGIALFSTVLAITAFFFGMELIGPSRASILSTFEPVVTVILSVTLLSEPLLPAQAAGGFLILISAVLLQAGGGKGAKKRGAPAGA